MKYVVTYQPNCLWVYNPSWSRTLLSLRGFLQPHCATRLTL
jgi:hypothetical protein